jgi:hypothetical protein
LLTKTFTDENNNKIGINGCLSGVIVPVIMLWQLLCNRPTCRTCLCKACITLCRGGLD